MDYEELHQMITNMRSQMGGTCVLPYWPNGPRDD